MPSAKNLPRQMKKAAPPKHVYLTCHDNEIKSSWIIRPLSQMMIFASVLGLTGCETSTLPSNDFALSRPAPSIEAPCKWPDPPADGSSRTLQIKMTEVYAALADCAERKHAAQEHYRRQQEAIKRALR